VGLALALAAVLGLPVSSRPLAQPASGRLEIAAALSALEPALSSDFARDGIGGASIGVVDGDKLVWSRHYGFADVEARRVATNDSAYRIGSITKQFTALALLQLVEQGRMRLSDPIEKYVPEIKAVTGATAGAAPITLLQVATMMSGLEREPDCADHSVGPVSGWQKKALECLPQTRYRFEPGTEYLYSNIGYATLGLAIERAAGRPFIDVVAHGIFLPLGMTRSAFDPTPAIRGDLAHGYQRGRVFGTSSRAVPDQKLDGRGYRVPNGAIFSTLADLAKFVAWELGGGPSGILDRATQDANYTRAYSAFGSDLSSSYGLGFVVSRRGGIVMLGHGGATEGYHASAIFHRATRLGVIVLRGCDSCTFEAAPVAARILEHVVTAARAAPRQSPSAPH
jgi:CubicO group peptidase (beta-lactamase class C family)